MMTSVPNQRLQNEGVFELLRGNVFDSAILTLYQEHAPRAAYICVATNHCTQATQDQMVFNASHRDQFLASTLFLELREDLTVELIEDPAAYFGWDIDVPYDAGLALRRRCAATATRRKHARTSHAPLTDARSLILRIPNLCYKQLAPINDLRNSSYMNRNPVLLIILDGWGIRETEAGNAVALAKTPNFDRWLRACERAIVHTSGEHVGLTPGQMGNSEVGHLNLGAGRIVYQDISRIANAVADGALAEIPVLQAALSHLRSTGKKLHLIGLLGSGGVHSHSDHLFALLDIARAQGINPVLHLITDGRDTPTQQGIQFCAELLDRIAADANGRVATVSGRYYAMDRDQRWERSKRAYDAMAFRQSADRAPDALTAIQQSYDNGVSDEFIPPTVIGADNDLGIDRGDVLLCYNFRADRMRQLTQAFVSRDFDGADNFQPIADLRLITMTEYLDGLTPHVLFPVELLSNTLAETLSKAGKRQYHTAETEKYPHVTFFFNGRNEAPFPGEYRLIVPSPKVATYDLKPEMSAPELTDQTLKRLQSHDDDFVLVNFANPDMVGHTGSLPAAIKAVETVDSCAGKLVDATLDKGGVAIVTADHGNCERMIDSVTGAPHTYHTVGPVSLFVIDAENRYDLHTWGRLADVAPTVLDLLGIEQPPEMTGTSLIRAAR